MTSPVTTEVLVDRKALRKAILAAIPENVPLRGRYATAIMEQAVAPLLAALQQVTAERDEARKEARDLREGIRDACDEATHHRNACLIAQRERDAANAELARLRAEMAHGKG